MSRPNIAHLLAMASLIMLVSWVIWNEINTRVCRKKSMLPFYILKIIHDEARLNLDHGVRQALEQYHTTRVIGLCNNRQMC